MTLYEESGKELTIRRLSLALVAVVAYRAADLGHLKGNPNRKLRPKRPNRRKLQKTPPRLISQRSRKTWIPLNTCVVLKRTRPPQM